MGIFVKKPKTAKLYEMNYEPLHDRYLITIRKVPVTSLPADCVHVTGKKGSYFLDKTGLWEMPDPERLSAIDLYLYMVNNSISDALANRAGIVHDMDFMKIVAFLIVAVIGIAVVFAIV